MVRDDWNVIFLFNLNAIILHKQSEATLEAGWANAIQLNAKNFLSKIKQVIKNIPWFETGKSPYTKFKKINHC